MDFVMRFRPPNPRSVDPDPGEWVAGY
jgi:hypothetical protein